MEIVLHADFLAGSFKNFFSSSEIVPGEKKRKKNLIFYL